MANDALVVIGAGGIGEAIVRRCGAGRSVLLADFSERLLERVADDLRGDGYEVAIQQVDVALRESVAALAGAAAKLGPVRSVVHTAGLSPTQAPPRAILSVNLVGAAHVLDEFANVVAAGAAGVIVSSMAGTMAADRLPAELEEALASAPADELLSLPLLEKVAPAQSTAGLTPGNAYGIATRGNQLRVQAASTRWGARGARINSVSPGVVATPMARQELGGASGGRIRAMIDGSAAGRMGTPADIANAVAFLLGPEASFITGTDLLVDGGVVAGVRSGAIALTPA